MLAWRVRRTRRRTAGGTRAACTGCTAAPPTVPLLVSALALALARSLALTLADTALSPAAEAPHASARSILETACAHTQEERPTKTIAASKAIAASRGEQGSKRAFADLAALGRAHELGSGLAVALHWRLHDGHLVVRQRHVHVDEVQRDGFRDFLRRATLGISVPCAARRQNTIVGAVDGTGAWEEHARGRRGETSTRTAFSGRGRCGWVPRQ
eukprot:2902498-Rhodomonas_salina.1